MKLVFPNGEHASVILAAGVTRVGSDPEANIVLTQPGVLPRHFEIHAGASGVNVQRPETAESLTVNGRPVVGMMALRNGDQLGFAGIVARFVSIEATRPAPGAVPGAPQDSALPVEDISTTKVRAVAPRFVLRGVSGAVFGKTYAITGPMTLGRSSECDIVIPADEISRRHAMVRPNPEGLAVEDLGSSNGSFINNRRVLSGQLLPGDELRLDQVRLLLVAPGTELQQAQQSRPLAEPVAPPRGSASWIKPLAAVVIVGSLAFIVGLLLLR